MEYRKVMKDFIPFINPEKLIIKIIIRFKANQTKTNQTKWTQPTPEDEQNNEWYSYITGTNERKIKRIYTCIDDTF
jgi:hypothetical protein